jgi:hypothetical protein
MHLKHLLHIDQNLLVGGCGTALKVRNDSWGLVYLCGEVLLRHWGAFVVFGLRAGFLDGVTDFAADGLGFDDFVGAVDFGQVLAFCAAALVGLLACCPWCQKYSSIARHSNRWSRFPQCIQKSRSTWKLSRQPVVKKQRVQTYRVGASKLLLSLDDGTLPPGSVQLCLATNNLLLGHRAATGTDFATDLGDGFPVVRHGGGLWVLQI